MTRLSIFVIFFVILAIVAISSGKNSYCNICPDHTLCIANEWDNELATIAQAQANSCHYGHDSCRKVKRFSVGQNIAEWPTARGSQPATVESLIKLWYEEVKLFNRNYINRFKFKKATGHYTQMLWAKTTKIGCGYVNYLKDKLYTVYLVCNYGPAGNYKNAQMYKIRK